MNDLEQKLLALHAALQALDLPDDTEVVLRLPEGSLTVIRHTLGHVTLGPGDGQGVSQHFDLRLSLRRELPTLPGHVVPEPDE